MRTKVFLLLTVMTLLFLGTGCSTVMSRRQALVVTGIPNHSVLYQDGEKLSEVPGVVSVDRRSETVLEIKSPNQIYEKKLSGQFRWVDSLVGNLLLMGYAPVGLLVDWLNGSIWNFPAERIDFGQKEKQKTLAETLRGEEITVLPPVGGNISSSLRVGRLIDRSLASQYSQIKIVNPDRTAAQMDLYGVYDEGLDVEKFTPEMLGVMGTRFGTLSWFGLKDGRYQVRTETWDLLTPQKLGEGEFDLPREKVEGSNWKSQAHYFAVSLLPNTFGVGTGTRYLIGYDPEAAKSLRSVILRSRPGASGLDSLFLSGSNLKRRYYSSLAHAYFNWKTSAGLDYDLMSIDEYSGGLVWTYNLTSLRGEAGIGPEVGLRLGEMDFSLYYIGLVGLNYAHLDDGGSVFRGSLDFGLGFSWAYFFSERFRLRMAVDAKSYDSRFWSEVAEMATGSPSSVTTSSIRVALFAEYLYPEARAWALPRE